MQAEPRLIISCGKTGGHLFPAIAVAQECDKLFKNKVKIQFFISGKDMEKNIIKGYGYPVFKVPGKSFPGMLSIRLFPFLISQTRGILKVLWSFIRNRPVACFITGGYTSFPVGLGAILLNIPLFIQEQNLYPGKVNRSLAPFARKVFVPFDETKKHIKTDKVILTGNPLRKEIIEIMRKNITNQPPPGKKKFTVFLTGGSQGATSISNAGVEFLKLIEKQELIDQFKVYFHTGHRDYNRVFKSINAMQYRGELELKPFFYKIFEIYRETDFIICRAGAMTISEVTAFGIPSLLVPYPYAAEDHQTKNAELLVEKQAGFLVRDRDLTGLKIFQLVMEVFNDTALQVNMKKNSKRLSITDGAHMISKHIREDIETENDILCF